MRKSINVNSSISKELYSGKAVSEEIYREERRLPLIITPQESDINLKTWMIENINKVEANLCKFGGILFRGFGIDTVEKFNFLMQIFTEKGTDYVFRSSPRHSLADRVYESTTYPSDRKINMHSEQSYSYALIQKIVFCCIKEATEQGETPIADNRNILENLSADLRKRFSENGILYQRNLSSHIGIPWQEVFQTSNKDEVIKNCTENDIEYKFDGDDRLQLKWRKPAIITHPITGEEAWFNHSFFFNKYSLYEEMGIDHTEGLPEEFLAYDTFFGDGSEITYEEHTDVKNAHQKEKIVFPWQKGDVLFLDNILSSHGRNPFTGERQIVVSMV
jgi:alpha-ketoglutarate-dependent taurine dioxygenase